MADIPVGDSPAYIFGDPRVNAIYVANSGSNGTSVINTKTNKVSAEVTFDKIPSGGVMLNTII